MNALSIGGIISGGFATGLKNLVSLVLALVLWILTIWIPYINVGTTIGILAIVVAMSKGGVISPTEIFNPAYRKYMGEFFLLVGIIYLGISIGTIFLIIPGLVISIAWMLAVYLLIDRELNPMEAIKVSNQLTYGHKWTIFLGLVVLGIFLTLIVFVLGSIGSLLSDTLGTILSLVGTIVFVPIILGAYAHIYAELVQQLDQAAS